jgi:hypothetical protein
VRINPRTGQVTARSVAGLVPGGYGATWFTAQGDLIAYENGVSRPYGTMTWIANPATAPAVISQQQGPPTMGNDGAAFVGSPSMANLSVVVNVLANDGDPGIEPDPSTLQILRNPQEGTATINADDTITYTSDSRYRGSDSFSYRVCDASGQCGEAVVDITSAPGAGSTTSPNG